MFFKKQRLIDLPSRLDKQELVKRTRIVVVDDSKNDFPFEILQNEGYAIQHWPDVQAIEKLENGFFDIIVLDIGGVGQVVSPETEGLGILQHIKKANPSQIVIAYSGQSYESKQIPFFQLADIFVPKPASAVTWKETIDSVIATRLSVAHYWATIKHLLARSGATPKQVAQIESQIVRAANGKSVSAEELLSKYLGHADNLATVVAILAKLLSLTGAS